ncbi:MFS transporter [Amycolatopsis sp. FDAARGOS 1241]|uniref:MFS transporter n=1 Tax=Amycolatopsis sp. FDAARGOS 1241 TaxID=2778070 RepID=UPI00194F99EA|nr:MFS transporter [Amycolatopsis sp. FDAARGOS 1241]QRP43709.1 MFS transporter [Amycolatopsis sp. FDAARGOS 1241]
MSTNAPVTDERLTPEARRSVVGGILSLFVDSFDIYLPALVLPAVMDYFEPDSMSATTKVTLVTVIFVVTLLGRPIGGPIFGNLADKIGRRRVTLITGVGFTVVTLLIGLMPGYATWGYGSIVGLILLRLIGGIFLGGGYAGPVPLAIERSPMRRRGLVGGVMAAGAPAAITLISIIQLVVLERFPDEELKSWGWRIPFFFGFLLGIAYIAYYSRVPEVDLKELKKSREGNRAPIFELFSRRNIRGFGQVFLLMTGMWFAAQVVLSFMPGLLVGVLHQNPSNVSTLEIVANVATIISMILAGVLGQRIGRRKLLLGCAVAITVGASLAYLVLVLLARSGAGFLPIAFVAFVLPNAPLGCLVVYLNERFGAGVRSSGYGSVYTLSLILPALYSVWITVLQTVMPYEYTAVVLIVLGGVLFFAGAWIGPETRGTVLLGAPAEPAASRADTASE